MRGSTAYQVNQIFDTIKAYGHSKHTAKEEARINGAVTWHEMGKQLLVYSYATANKYREVWKDTFNYIKENFKTKDILQITNEHINAFLETKIADGVKYSTFQTYAAALEKLETALNKYTQSTNYKFDLTDVRKEAQSTLEKTTVTRAYENPKGLIEAIKNPMYKIIATAQLQGGFRVSELNYISKANFLSNNRFLVTNGKGGLQRTIELPENVYNALKDLVVKLDTNQKFIFEANNYRDALKSAANATNQPYTGSHGLRWNFAQENFKHFEKIGYGFEQALSAVSHLLGHQRADITKHYLKV